MTPAPRYWVLDGHTPVPASDLFEWAEFFERGLDERRVALDHIEDPAHDAVQLSTVFIGVDLSLLGPVPLLFESRVIGGPLDGHTWRYPTWSEAEAGHRRLLNAVHSANQALFDETRERLLAIAGAPRGPEEQ